MGSRTNLIGTGNKWELVEKYSNELHVTAQTPPTFLILADDDGGVPPRNSIEFYMALKKFKIPAEMHIFKDGGHGFGMNKKNLPVDQWPKPVCAMDEGSGNYQIKTVRSAWSDPEFGVTKTLGTPNFSSLLDTFFTSCTQTLTRLMY